MTIYHNFVGIDIGKYKFVVSIYNKADTKEYENNRIGIRKFLKDYKNVLKDALCILETTGGYEIELLYTLCDCKYATHRADTRKVKNFIRSYGNAVKTDALDAKALSRYGFERHEQLELFKPQSKQALSLFTLLQRRNDLKHMLVAEKNRLQCPNMSIIKTNCQDMIDFISAQIKKLTKQINQLIDSNDILKKKKEVLKTIPGIGEIIASELLILLPELGMLDRRKIASLVGLAPQANDSGKYQGYRRTGHGRGGIKPSLFLAAMAARRSKTRMKDFYEKLANKGKKKMVALTALMRKLIVIANARIRDFNCFGKIILNHS